VRTARREADGVPAVLRALRDSVAGLVDLALPAVCVGCAAPGAVLCAACSGPLAGPARAALPVPAPAGLPVPWAVAAYDGVVRATVVAHKESGRRTLARPLGAALARSVVAAAGATDGRPLVLVPAPSRRSAVRERGDDPTLRIARRAASVLRADGRDVRVLPVLRLRRGVVDQSGLTAAQRAANLSGAMWLPPRLGGLVTGRSVVVVDDVVTTGATLADAARALVEGGAKVPAAAVVAATPRRTRGWGSDPGSATGVSRGTTWD
jgi:predicted amidophosphoribosyltransferase